MGIEHYVQLWNVFSKKARIEAWVHELEKKEVKENLEPPKVMFDAHLYSYIPWAAIKAYGERATDRLNEARALKGEPPLPKDYSYQLLKKMWEEDRAQIQEEGKKTGYPEWGA